MFRVSFSFTATAALAVALLWAHPAVAQFNGQFVERNLVDHPVCVASSSSAFISAADAVDDESVGEAALAIDGNADTAWWSAATEAQSWFEVDLGPPAERIGDLGMRATFQHTFGDQWEGFKIRSMVIHWHGWLGAADYIVRTSVDGADWVTRATRRGNTVEFDRMDELPSFGVRDVDQVRYIRIELEAKATCASVHACRQLTDSEEARVFGIRDVEVVGLSPSAGVRASALQLGMLVSGVISALSARWLG